jgi:uncharacterized protein YfeS
MRPYTTITLLTSLFFIGCADRQSENKSIFNGQQNNMESFEYKLKSAHPNAQALMTDSFYFSPIEETAPFGSDDGSDAAYGFRQWRLTNKALSPIKYLDELFARWGYPYFDLNEIDTVKISEYINKKAILDEAAIQEQIKTLKEMNNNSGVSEMNKLDDKQFREIINSSAQAMGGMYLLGKDNAIIGTSFAQFVLEGKIDDDIKNLTKIALKDSYFLY